MKKIKKNIFLLKKMKKVREVFEKISEHKFRLLCEVQNLKGEISKLRFCHYFSAHCIISNVI